MSLSASPSVKAQTQQSFYILLFVSAAHLLNDAMQAVVPAVFPLFQQNLHLSFAQIGWVAFALNVTASVLQPLIGAATDKKPMPLLLPAGMGFTLLGMAGLAYSSTLWMLLMSAMLIGIGSSVLHPESSRVAHLAAGSGKGLAQSIFQVGGNTGQALAPLAAALLVAPLGIHGLLWFVLTAALGIAIQCLVSRWYRRQMLETHRRTDSRASSRQQPVNWKVAFAVGILILMLFSKFVYLAGMTGYYAFYYMEKFKLPLESAQFCLFALQLGGMAGTLLGGPLADRFGRKKIIWFSILGTAPFSLLLPYAGSAFSILLCLIIGSILMSGFSVIVVYAQELLPGRIGMVSGLFFGLAFGLGGIGSVVLGRMIDGMGVTAVIQICSWLPLLGVFALWLPKEGTQSGVEH